MEEKKELKEIRAERKKVEQEEIGKPQKRSIEVIEFEDGSYALSNRPAWVLPLKKTEVLDAVEAWRDGSLDGIPLS